MSASTDAITSDSWILRRNLRGPEARLRLFCFPYAGAGASIFRTWPDGLPSDIEVCPVQLPGHGTRLMERPFTQVSPLVQALAQALIPLADRPFAFFGHSLGALICFELGRQMRRQYGVHPLRLFVSAARAPQIPLPGPPIHALPENEFLAQLRRLNGTPEELLANQELMEIMAPVLRADFALYETYEYSTEPPLNCPITAFGGLDDRKVGDGDLEAWRTQTSATFSRRMLPGDHFFMKHPALLRMISQELQ